MAQATTGLNRRDFLRGATLTSLGIAFTGEEITALAQGNAQKPAQGAAARPDDDLKSRTVTFAGYVPSAAAGPSSPPGTHGATCSRSRRKR